jgi:hypothetical protein
MRSPPCWFSTFESCHWRQSIDVLFHVLQLGKQPQKVRYWRHFISGPKMMYDVFKHMQLLLRYPFGESKIIWLP